MKKRPTRKRRGAGKPAAEESPRRIVSLIASATEIVCALGLEERLVGRSHECDFPESVKRLPALTGPKFDVTGSSCEIDQRVQAILRDGLSVYRVDPGRLKGLRPDAVVTQTQCEVCAVSLRDVEEALADWTGGRPRLIALEPNALADVFRDFRRTAAALGVAERGEELARRIDERMQAIARRARAIEEKPAVACIEWIEPLMAAGNWMPELVELAGGRNLFGAAGKHSPRLDWEELRAKDPDAIVIAPCGYPIAQSRDNLPALAAQPGWTTLRAVKNSRVLIADGNQYFNRPGPRLADSLDILAEILHPESFPPAHEGAGWERL